MKLYLAGPMRGYPDCNFPAFHKAAAELRAAGYEVWSPAENDVVIGLTSVTAQNVKLKDAMRLDLPALLDQDAIAVLEGWERSTGATLEAYVANAVGMSRYTVAYLLEHLTGLQAQHC